MDPRHRPVRESRRVRHVYLGRRLEVLQLIRSGRLSVDEAAALMDVSIQEVYRWQTVHASDHIVSFGQTSGPAATPEELELLARRRRLFRLLRSLEADLRQLHAQLVASMRTPRRTLS